MSIADDSANKPAKEALIEAFRRQYWADRSSGAERGLVSYLTEFSGQDTLIAAEYALLQRHRDGHDSGRRARIGPYILLEPIGRGGQGSVHLAEDTRLKRRVAIKILGTPATASNSALERFWREAEIAFKLEHPAICQVYDAGVEDNIPYIVMRYVVGRTLAAMLAEARSKGSDREASILCFDDDEPAPLPAEVEPEATPSSSQTTRAEVLRHAAFFAELAEATHHAHERGILHRDLKPANVMVTPEGRPVILDFGLARDASQELASLTQSGDLFGTPAYMAPEQVNRQGKESDRRVDIWALGVSLYETLTLHRPFDGATREQIYHAIIAREPKDPRQFNPAIPKDLVTVIETALAKDPDRRYQTAEDFARDLAAVQCGEPIAARPVGILGRVFRAAKRRPLVASLLALVMLLLPVLAGTVGYLAAKRGDIQLGESAKRDAELQLALERGFAGVLTDRERSGKDATSAFEEALAIVPNHPLALLGLSADALHRGPEAAERCLKRYGDAIASDQNLHALRVALLLGSGAETEAQAALGSLEDPTNSHGFCARALLGYYRWIYSEEEAAGRDALRWATLAVMTSDRPRSMNHALRAILAMRLGAFEAAAETARAIRLLWPEEPELNRLSTIVLARSEPAQGFEAAEALRAAGLMDSGLGIQLAGQFLMAGSRDLAAQLLSWPESRPREDLDLQLRLADVQAGLGQRALVKVTLDQAEELASDDLAAKATIAARAAVLGDYPRMRRLAVSVARESFGTPLAQEMRQLMVFGEVDSDRADSGERDPATIAEAEAEETGERDPASTAKGPPLSKRVNEGLRRASGAASGNYLAMSFALRGKELLDEGKAADAIKSLERSLRYMPERRILERRLWLAQAYRSAGQADRGLLVVLTGTELAPHEAGHWHDYARYRTEAETELSARVKGRTPTALAAAERASALEPKASEYLATLADLLSQLGRVDEALSAQQRLLALFSEEGELNLNPIDFLRRNLGARSAPSK